MNGPFVTPHGELVFVRSERNTCEEHCNTGEAYARFAFCCSARISIPCTPPQND